MLERFTEPSETLCLLDYWFIIIEHISNSGTARYKRCIRTKYGERVKSLHTLPKILLFPKLHMTTNSEALQTPLFWNFMEVSGSV